MFGFIIAIAAGFATPHLEKPLAEPLVNTIKSQIPIEDGEVRLIAFMLAMFVAALVCAAIGAGSTFGIIIGGIVGYFGTRIVARVQSATKGATDEDES